MGTTQAFVVQHGCDFNRCRDCASHYNLYLTKSVLLRVAHRFFSIGQL